MSSQVAFLEGSNFNISQDISYTPLSTGKKIMIVLLLIIISIFLIIIILKIPEIFIL